MHILLIFILGVCVLAGAIILNFLGSLMGFPSWYDFIRSPQNTSPLSYLWLFGLYPLGLGLIAYASEKFLSI